MPNSRATTLIAFAVALPLLTLVFGTARSEIQLRTSEDWEFIVRGSDPRDLLRGHYINYRIEFGEQGSAVCANDDPECCLCLTRADETTFSALAPLPRVRRTSCVAARTTCDGVFQTRYISSLNRYYVPELRARGIERQLQAGFGEGEARIVLAIDKMGRAQVKELRVGGQRLE